MHSSAQLTSAPQPAPGTRGHLPGLFCNHETQALNPFEPLCIMPMGCFATPSLRPLLVPAGKHNSAGSSCSVWCWYVLVGAQQQPQISPIPLEQSWSCGGNPGALLHGAESSLGPLQFGARLGIPSRLPAGPLLRSCSSNEKANKEPKSGNSSLRP